MAISEYPSLQLANRQTDLNSAVEQIWQGKGNELMRPIFDTYNDDLHRAVASDSEETAKLFKNNVSRLAAAKSNYTIQLLEGCKADINGVERSKEEYLKAAKVVVGRANRAQAAEYNTTSHRCRVAKQWAQFTQEKRLFPNIEWLRTRSASPRELHLTYVGRIWSMDDKFLVNNTPGCIYNCKCDWKNTDKAATDNTDIKPVPVSPGLEGNPYYTDQIFTDKHPYFSRVDKHIPDVGVLYNPDDVVYMNKVTASGVKYKEHFLCLKEPETVENAKIVEALVKHKVVKEATLLPRIHTSETALRERYYGKAYQAIQKTKCPDCMGDGNLLEFKLTDANHLSKNVLKASQQADIAVIKCTDVVSKSYLERFANWQFSLDDRSNLKKIIVMTGEDVHVFVK